MHQDARTWVSTLIPVPFGADSTVPQGHRHRSTEACVQSCTANHAKNQIIRKKDIKASAMQGEKEKDYETKKLNTACTKKTFLIVVANLHIFLLFSYNI